MLVDKRVVGGEERGEVFAVPDDVFEEAARLFGHRRGNLDAEFGIEPAVTNGEQQAVEAHPLAEELVERLAAAWVFEHAANDSVSSIAIVQLPAVGGREQILVGRCVPEEVGQTARRPVRRRRLVAVEEEARRHQHRLHHGLGSSGERLACRSVE